MTWMPTRASVMHPEGNSGVCSLSHWELLYRCLCVVLKKSCLVRWLLPGIFLMTVIKEVMAYQVGILTAKFYPVLANQAQEEFFELLLTSTGIVTVMALVVSLLTYIVAATSIVWRKALTEHIHSKYFDSDNFYKVNCVEIVTNPDQRITQDVKEFCQNFCESVPPLLISPFLIVYYSHQSVTITGSFMSPMIVLIFAILCSTLNKVFMAPIVDKVCENQQREGAFRKQHLEVATNAENIVFIRHADRAELGQSEKLLDRLIHTQHAVAIRNLLLNLALNWSRYFYAILAFIIAAIPIFAGVYKDVKPAELSGIISKNTFITMYLSSSFTNLLDVAQKLVTVEAMVRRVTILMDSFDDEELSLWDDKRGEPAFKLNNVSIETPNGIKLIENLTMEISCARNILVSGPSSVGKTSLFRVLRGLWKPASGTVSFEGDGDLVLFVTPRTFLGSSCGTLRGAVTYPVEGAKASDEEIFDRLEVLKLTHLLRNNRDLDAPIPENTLDALSPGEKQRLVLCRILVNKPRLALIDEAFNSLDRAVVGEFFKRCESQKTTLVTISHQVENLSPFHHELLTLQRGGTWHLKPIP